MRQEDIKIGRDINPCSCCKSEETVLKETPAIKGNYYQIICSHCSNQGRKACTLGWSIRMWNADNPKEGTWHYEI